MRSSMAAMRSNLSHSGSREAASEPLGSLKHESAVGDMAEYESSIGKSSWRILALVSFETAIY